MSVQLPNMPTDVTCIRTAFKFNYRSNEFFFVRSVCLSRRNERKKNFCKQNVMRNEN